jgi:hypothetical protein
VHAMDPAEVCHGTRHWDEERGCAGARQEDVRAPSEFARSASSSTAFTPSFITVNSDGPDPNPPQLQPVVLHYPEPPPRSRNLLVSVGTESVLAAVCGDRGHRWRVEVGEGGGSRVEWGWVGIGMGYSSCVCVQGGTVGIG